MDTITKLQMVMAYATTMRCKATLLVYHGCGQKRLLWWN